MGKYRRDDEGLAMLTALLVIVIVTGLGLVSFSVATHNNDQTAADRRRLQSVAAAEGGLDVVIQRIESSTTTALPCSGTGALTSPNSSPAYDVTIAYRDAAGAALACPMAASAAPRKAVLTATGKIPGYDGQRRKMEMLLNVDPILGGFGAAIFADTTLNLNNNLTLQGNNGNDADIYTNANFTCTNSPRVYGALYAQGTASLAGSCRFEERVWSNGNLRFDNSASTAEDGISSTGSITVPGSGIAIEGDATAGTTIGAASGVAGTRTQNRVQGPPPSQAFPQINYSAAAWTANPGPAYTERTFTDCNAARNFIQGSGRTANTKYVVRITATCDLQFANNTNFTVDAPMAIVTDGSVTFENQVDIRSSSSTVHDLHIIVPYRTNSGSVQSCAGTVGDLTLSNNTALTNLNVFLYTPCQADVRNRTNLNGQVFGEIVGINNQFTMTFRPVLVPGYGDVLGYRASVAYAREIR